MGIGQPQSTLGLGKHSRRNEKLSNQSELAEYSKRLSSRYLYFVCGNKENLNQRAAEILGIYATSPVEAIAPTVAKENTPVPWVPTDS